jgi:secondary thiamine-phosphate synthase enzyme
MRTHQSNTVAKTSGPPDLVDITDEILDAARASGLKDGHVTVFASEGGCSLIVNERESGLLQDMKAAIERVATGNGDLSAIGHRSTVFPLVDGELKLGSWQRIMLVELEEPAARTVVVQVVGE